MAFSLLPGGTSALTLLPLGVRSRLTGPGGFYNLGNILGLAVGVGLQIRAGSGAVGLVDFFVGSSSAVCLTLANLIFFISGECYHRAWAKGAPPDQNLNRRGDVLSGYGAILLGFALVLLGQPLLALFSGALHAGGKFGSALQSEFGLWPRHWPDPFRAVVLVSRVPAMTAAGLGVAHWNPNMPMADLVALFGLLGSYLLWVIADLKLLRG
jgi:hypothetical protein